MANNNIPLLTASKGLVPQTRDMVIETIIQYNQILNVLPVIPVTQGFTHHELEEKEGALGTVAFRSLNDDYTDSHGEFRERMYAVKQLGGSMKVDKKLERQIPGTLTKQMMLRLKNLGLFVNDKFFNGNSATDKNEFDGLKRILGDTGSFVVAKSGGLAINSSAANFKYLLKLFDEANRGLNGGANAYLMSDVMYDSITQGAREVGANVLGTATDFLGNQVAGYLGVPFIKFKNNPAGTAILPQTETVEVASSGSIYAVRFDELDGVAGLSTGGINILPDEDNLFHRDVIDFDLGLRVTTNSAMRIAGLTIS
jgi:hypothetical protein